MNADMLMMCSPPAYGAGHDGGEHDASVDNKRVTVFLCQGMQDEGEKQNG